MRRYTIIVSRFAAIFSLLMFLSCCSKQSHTDFKFFDAMNRQYTLANLKNKFIKYYGYAYSPFIILLETNKNDNISYQKQLKILRNLPDEQLQAIIITANSEKEDKSGYHTSIKTAKQLSGENVDFRVTIISPKKNIITQSNEIIDIENIKSIIQNFNN